jgi:hypothetical protein
VRRLLARARADIEAMQRAYTMQIEYSVAFKKQRTTLANSKPHTANNSPSKKKAAQKTSLLLPLLPSLLLQRYARLAHL